MMAICIVVVSSTRIDQRVRVLSAIWETYLGNLEKFLAVATSVPYYRITDFLQTTNLCSKRNHAQYLVPEIFGSK